MRDSAIAVSGLRKVYGDKTVLDGIDLDVPAGTVFSLLAADWPAPRGEEDLTLRVPGDGRAKSLRALLDRLGEHSAGVEEFSVHTPELDDVFLALTAHPSTQENTR